MSNRNSRFRLNLPAYIKPLKIPKKLPKNRPKTIRKIAAINVRREAPNAPGNEEFKKKSPH